MSIIETGECKIDRLGKDGIGIAKTKTGVTEIPYVLEGEIVAFEKHEYRKQSNCINRGIINASSDRIKPPCQYFTICGGCMLQHMNESAYSSFKYNLISEALAKVNITTEIRPMVSLPKDGRRRANMLAIKKNGQVFLGFQRFRSNQIINIDKCLTLAPELSNLIQPMKLLFTDILEDKERVQVCVNIVHNGIDLLIEYPKFKKISEIEREYISQFAIEHDITRLQISYDGATELIFQKENPYIIFGDIPVRTSTASFLQANRYADKVLQDLVLEALDISTKASVVDLFCGLGTFAILLSKYFEVDAFESDEMAVYSLSEASSKYNLSLNAYQRDLYSKQLQILELNKYKYAIINPPRLGAKKQIIELAKSNIERIIYISCNPITFAREAFILCSNGQYELSYLTPIDQFTWNIHLEIVAIFTKILD